MLSSLGVAPVAGMITLLSVGSKLQFKVARYYPMQVF